MRRPFFAEFDDRQKNQRQILADIKSFGNLYSVIKKDAFAPHSVLIGVESKDHRPPSSRKTIVCFFISNPFINEFAKKDTVLTLLDQKD
jgi:hypothetical protein